MSSIIYKYLDKRAATVSAIKDFTSMQFIINNTDEKIREEHRKMTSVGSPRFDGMPHVHNPNANEERILKGIDEINVLKERYRQAVEYMDWFMPAWNQLSEEERDVLKIFYGSEMGTYGAVYEICDRYSIERSSAYNRKNRALTHLQTLLFGKD
ncbi:hypothetical protein [Lactimicrobium massiliense]|uniref:hypothetical protein n=1 Tax=Lactimicrobium massiliense TaxID=2161814 RepID=UPI000D55D94E|nr:hypothetical protein [Lactimicrobium massiliense]